MHAINVLFNAHNEEEWGILMVDASSTFNSINSLAILYSQGVTQRDPLLMLVYAIGTLPLIHPFENPQDDIQIWYADDASACAPHKDSFGKLFKEGPSYGYFPEPKKSFIAVCVKLLKFLCLWESKLLPVINCWVALSGWRRGGLIM